MIPLATGPTGSSLVLPGPLALALFLLLLALIGALPICASLLAADADRDGDGLPDGAGDVLLALPMPLGSPIDSPLSCLTDAGTEDSMVSVHLPRHERPPKTVS